MSEDQSRADVGHSVRRFIHDVHGQNYEAYATYAEARQAPDAAVVLSGDYGGTIYLTAPMRLVRCDEDTLNTLLSDLDAITWMGGDAYDASVAYERHAVPDGVWGGDGGGAVIEGVWTHPSWLDDEVAAYARQVVLGERTRLPGRLLRDRRAARIERRRQSRMTPQFASQRDRRGIAWDFDILDPVVPFPDEDD